jgi:hypothetical protein
LHKAKAFVGHPQAELMPARIKELHKIKLKKRAAKPAQTEK